MVLYIALIEIKTFSFLGLFFFLFVIVYRCLVQFLGLLEFF